MDVKPDAKALGVYSIHERYEWEAAVSLVIPVRLYETEIPVPPKSFVHRET